LRPEGALETVDNIPRPFRAMIECDAFRGRRPPALSPANFPQAFSLLKLDCIDFILIRKFTTSAAGKFYFACNGPNGPMVEVIAWQIICPSESLTIYGLPNGCQPDCKDLVTASSKSL
jgi:hypothetical protein